MIEFRMVMPVEIGPDAGVGIEVLAAVKVAEDGPAARFDDDGFPLEPIPHLRERMPVIIQVQSGQRMHGARELSVEL
jgi:hypothetical protein